MTNEIPGGKSTQQRSGRVVLQLTISFRMLSMPSKYLLLVSPSYRVVFLTGLPDFQYQNEKTCSANEELFYIENFVKN